MTSIYDNTVCDVKRQMSKHQLLRNSAGRVNSRLRTKTHPFYYTDWEDVLKREWNKRAPPLSPLEWKKKHAKNMNADDCCEFLMGRRCGRRRRLLFRSGYYLTIQPDGSVKGTKQKDSPYAIVEICSVGAGLVKIAGVETEFFLTIDDSGVLRATDADSEECVFEEAMVKDFFSAYKSYAYSNEHWTVAISDEDGRAYSARCQGPLDSDLHAHSLPEMVPDSDSSSDEDSTPDNETSRYCEADTSRYLGMDASRFLETQTSRLIDLLNFDLEVCLMAELKEEDAKNVVAFPDSNTDIGPSLSEILRELGTNL
ncbi:uncharacterized protein LOC110051924 [Orbicella faveolata]|uniref:uncharacterized protein LOC110051923 n=1 Tax=Orbicella faveolata TaxID=48498 RepID=UPI0009E38057|nr:uncharacterized protein LOC110051923 [Orbicella faveolata]XP_020613683.1 uncharacterized protein LOC110051923 [Orbicella faveolata]XP_020613684.1 uncharacterized protein LOC110051923 [Orbicella faveolata]XP_020613685.1 uncharacterized protein LOC110051923 [Orbicella faveolata]XP_020613686.1 uncharacterized protein LOC110051923 [Orbicella faveolata]XP_020613687.1 uncharacterized protein LOC110051923 [Orbicella faveolata]XP_020613688.1 uncharacterized protein LOC110051924 [Orbicella faveolat